MKTTLFKKNSAFLLLMLMITSVTFSQGLEDFTNLNISTGSYSSGNFTGNNGIAWDYVEVRGTNASSVTYPNVDHPAMILRQASDNSSITSSLIPNGIQDFSVKLYKGFTGNGPRQVEVLINGQPVGQSVPFDDFDEHIFTVNNINVAGDFTLEIRNVTSSQVVIDDISWTAYNPGVNLPPTISQITLTPDVYNITSTDIVTVEASITDPDGVASATLNWGTTSGALTNAVPMTLTTGTTYSANIPAQADGTTVYFEITATDSLSETTTTQEYTYTVTDIPILSLPYANGFRTQSDYDQAENLGFTLTNTTQQTSAGGYLRIEANGSVTTPLIDFSVLDAILFDFSMTSFGGNSGQGLQVSISEDGGSTFTALDFYEVPSSSSNYIDYTQFVDVSTSNSTDGMIRVSLVPGTSNSHVVRFRDMNITEFSGYFYSNGWSPANPELISTVADDVYVVQGTVDILSDLNSKNFKVLDGATANIYAVLTVAEDLHINGNLRFISGPSGIGELAEMSPSSNIYGHAEVQIYSSNRRAYRMVSSSVTTTTSIHNNWQEGAVSNTDDPTPGFGTHITGTLIDQQDGFDATATGNPSMFVVDIPNQEFISIDNTDVNILTAGTPYLMFIRGDRSIDLTNNTSQSSTILRAFGELQRGDINMNYPAMQAGEFAMFGNPYQSSVDVTQVFAASDSINTAHYYVFDPNLGTNGAYVTVDLTTGSGTNTSGSPANEYLQPGQAAQFATIQNGSPVIKFAEDFKAPGNHTPTSAQRMTAMDMITFQLFTTDNFNNGQPLHDSFGILFSSNYTNDVDSTDALKPMNFNENMGLNVNGHLISLERRALPVAGEMFQIHTSGYSTQNYTFKMMIDGLENVAISLYDAYENTYTPLLSNDVITYSFEVSESDVNSMAEDRFTIIVEDLLNVNSFESSNIRIYPNPIVSDSFTIMAPNRAGKNATVSVIDMLGRTVYSDVHTFADNTVTVDVNQNMNEGIYIVKLEVDGETQTFRVIKR